MVNLIYIHSLGFITTSLAIGVFLRVVTVAQELNGYLNLIDTQYVLRGNGCIIIPIKDGCVLYPGVFNMLLHILLDFWRFFEVLS